MALDSASDLYVAGSAEVNVWTSEPNAESPITNLYTTKFSEAFLTKRGGNDGSKKWTKNLGGGSFDSFTGVAWDGTNIWVTGTTTSGDFPGTTSIGGNDVLLLKFDQSGNNSASYRYGTTAGDSGKGLLSDGTDLYLTCTMGAAYEGQTFGGTADSALIKVNPGTGAVVWARFIGGSGSESIANAVLRGTILTVGGATFSPTFDGLTASTSGDGFLIQFATDGTKQ
jgi:hypothetical protein